jgi:hypothetical protein
VDLGGSLAVASMGRFTTGVSTDLNGKSLSLPVRSPKALYLANRYQKVTYLSPGGTIGDKLRGSATCDKSMAPTTPDSSLYFGSDHHHSWKNPCLHERHISQCEGTARSKRKSYEVRTSIAGLRESLWLTFDRYVAGTLQQEPYSAPEEFAVEE